VSEDPKGFLKPWIREAEGALRALLKGKLDTAYELAKSLSHASPIDEAWKRYLLGLVALKAGKPQPAERELSRAAALAETAAKEMEANGQPEATRTYRLAAQAYEKLGGCYLSEDEFGSAKRMIESALEIRESHGSHAERWESVTSLRAIASHKGDHGAALQLALRALGHAEQLTERTDRCTAVTWDAISRSLMALGRHQEAIAAVLNALSYWQNLENPALRARGEMALAGAYLAWGRATSDKEPATSIKRLEAAIEHFNNAKSLFKEAGAKAQVESCRESLALAKSLLEG
jgi:tetratricopeptide (TPR) repeat protein